MNFYDILSSIFIFAGCVFILAGSIGVVRLTDALARSHALTKSMTLGIILLQMGMGVGLYEEISGLKIILAILFLLVTIPLAGHLFVMVVYRKLVKNNAVIIQSTKKVD